MLVLLIFITFDTYLYNFYNATLPANFDGTKQEVSFLNWFVVILSSNLSNDNVPGDNILMEKLIIMIQEYNKLYISTCQEYKFN